MFHTAKQSILEHRKNQIKKTGKVTLNPIESIKMVPPGKEMLDIRTGTAPRFDFN